MRKIEVKAFGYTEAVNKVKDFGYTNAVQTTAFMKNKTDEEIEKWLENKDDKTAYIVTNETGEANTRIRPYGKIVNNKVVAPVHKTRFFVLYVNNRVVGKETKKANAIKLAKHLMNDLQMDITCKVEYLIDSPNDLAFTLPYVPSKGTKEGTYTVYSK